MNRPEARIEEHIEAYRSRLLRGPLRLRALEEGHAGMASGLHPLAGSARVDVSALLYAGTRLPSCIARVDRVVIGESEDDLVTAGVLDPSCCTQVRAAARRRLTLYDGRGTLAARVCSPSDLDDLIPALTCYQIEWNKIHALLARSPFGEELAASPATLVASDDDIRRAIRLSRDDWQTLRRIWADSWCDTLSACAADHKDLTVEPVCRRSHGCRESVANWLSGLLHHFRDLDVQGRPVYFVSSNDHSIASLLSGFAIRSRSEILAHLLADERLREQWWSLPDDDVGSRYNLLYYATETLVRSDADSARALRDAEEAVGIRRYESWRFVDLRAQIIEIAKLQPDLMDSRLGLEGTEALGSSQALILNLDYPLGLTASHVLSEMFHGLTRLGGIYIMGKAATLYGRLGDVMIPRLVFDQHNQRLMRVANCFSLGDVRRHLRRCGVFDDQKAVTVLGTFLHNRQFIDRFRRDDYNSIDMEAGPYVSAFIDSHHSGGRNRPSSRRTAAEVQLDFGILHYASDTPYGRRASLLSSALRAEHAESVYACSLAILERILAAEIRQARRG